jgi:ABC-type transport system involved in multi-copper enzyme maturation permease subunit
MKVERVLIFRGDQHGPEARVTLKIFDFLQIRGDLMNAINLQILRTLIAKDWRLFRVPMLALIICGVGVYLIAMIAVTEDFRDHTGFPRNHLQPAMQTLCSASFGAIVLTGFLACALGGVAIARERAERSSDFIGLLPVTRAQIVISKLISSALMLLLFAVSHLLLGTVCLVAQWRIHGNRSIPGGIPWTPLTLGILWWFGVTTCFFGVGFVFSTFLASGPISACISIAVTTAAMVITAILMDGHHLGNQKPLLISAAVGLGIGLPSLTGGTIYYLKRIAP